ncbi:hypothetical protein HBB16_05230 [Pseudonocardia sp. MCCB 268]|nr:hypothetical protein [Pseudonocardia cytotoxica]
MSVTPCRIGGGTRRVRAAGRAPFRTAWCAHRIEPRHGHRSHRSSGDPAAVGRATRPDTVFDAENRHEIRAIWREVCAGYRLTWRVVPDDGPRAFPHIGQTSSGHRRDSPSGSGPAARRRHRRTSYHDSPRPTRSTTSA